MMASDSLTYPSSPTAWDHWILGHRPMRNPVSPQLPYAFHLEEERSASGEIVYVATIFLTNRECPWRCVMCDLWRNTLTEPVPAGAIPAQISYALSQLPPASQIKLYNSGSFFDPHAIPPEDDLAIVKLVSRFDRVIVESHPSLISDRCLRFSDLLNGRLEVAIGLETVHPVASEKLNKRASLSQFAHAGRILQKHAIALRSFVLVQPPFVAVKDAAYWVHCSIDFAFHCGAGAVSLIPTRDGNGAMKQLIATGDFVPPSLNALEDAVDYGIRLRQGRVFADLWDINRLVSCPVCAEVRIARLRGINRSQQPVARMRCKACSEAT